MERVSCMYSRGRERENAFCERLFGDLPPYIICNRSYDPAFQNTAVVTSRITYIDGDKGILRYRGYVPFLSFSWLGHHNLCDILRYPIEQLAEQSSFLEVAFLLINGSLPSKVLDKIHLWMFDKLTYLFRGNWMNGAKRS